MSDISLSKAVRSNLLSLKGTADMLGKTQERLATGNKVNSALDNPTNFFTASSLNSRAGDLNNLMDGMASGIQTLEAADNGLSSITKTLESMQSTLRQARQDKSFQTASYTMSATTIETGVTTDALAAAKELTVSGGAFAAGAEAKIGLIGGATATTELGASDATFDLDEAGDGLDFSIATNGGSATAVTVRGSTGANTITVDAGATSFTMDVADGAAVTRDELIEALNGGFAAVDMDVTVANDGGNLTFTGPKADDYEDASVAISAGVIANGGAGTALTLADFGFSAGTPTQTQTKTYEAKTVDQLVSEINDSDSEFAGKVRASNDNGKLRLENQSTQELTVNGVSSSGAIDGTSSGAAEILGNTVRSDLASQFNELRDQLDKLADDASFNGINLLRGDKLTITFNETGTSSIDIQTKDSEQVNAGNLGVSTTLKAEDLDSDANIDKELAKLKTALGDVRSQSSAFGSNLSIVQNRQDFTKSMINTLQTGAANLTLADMNEEAANLLALQTRQSLSSNSLSLASQADQSVLQLIR